MFYASDIGWSYHYLWSLDRDSNPGPFPYHGNALPTELSRHIERDLIKGMRPVQLDIGGKSNTNHKMGWYVRCPANAVLRKCFSPNESRWVDYFVIQVLRRHVLPYKSKKWRKKFPSLAPAFAGHRHCSMTRRVPVNTCGMSENRRCSID